VQSSFWIGDMDPNDLTLVVSGSVAEHTMLGSWEFAIPSDTRPQTGIFNGYFEGHRAEVILGATSVEILIFAGFDVFSIFDENPLRLYLADGTIIVPRYNGAEGDHQMATLQYSMDFVHPEDVVRVVFRGVEIGGLSAR